MNDNREEAMHDQDGKLIGYATAQGMRYSSSPPSAGSALPPHLRDDASFLRCSHCGRKSWGGDAVNSPCAMTQPDGSTCPGILEGQNH